jgi:hypothetical protein
MLYLILQVVNDRAVLNRFKCFTKHTEVPSFHQIIAYCSKSLLILRKTVGKVRITLEKKIKTSTRYYTSSLFPPRFCNKKSVS